MIRFGSELLAGIGFLFGPAMRLDLLARRLMPLLALPPDLRFSSAPCKAFLSAMGPAGTGGGILGGLGQNLCAAVWTRGEYQREDDDAQPE